MDRDSEAYNPRKLFSLNGGLRMCEDRIVNMVLVNSTDTLEKWIKEAVNDIHDAKTALYADVLLAEFVRHSVLDGFREVEATMRPAFELVKEADRKLKSARLATEDAKNTWEISAEDFRTKLKALGDWANSVALEQSRREVGIEPNPFTYMDVVGNSRKLKTPGDFITKHRESILGEVNFIRETLQNEVTAGHLERPVGMSDFESSLKALEAEEARAKTLLDEEADARALLTSAGLKYQEEKNRAIAVLRPLSDAGQWALYRLVTRKIESGEASTCI